MSDYTELIFGAELKRDTPDKVIDTLKHMLSGGESSPYLEFQYIKNPLVGFESSQTFQFSNASNRYSLAVISNVNHGKQDIMSFLEWIEPYLLKGDSETNKYAIVMGENDKEPYVAFLNPRKATIANIPQPKLKIYRPNPKEVMLPKFTSEPSMDDLPNQITQLYKDKLNELEKKKIEIIAKKLLERGIEMNMEEESKKRFKKLSKVMTMDNKEQWYYDDGSDHGMLVVEFYPTQIHTDTKAISLEVKFK